MILNILLFIGPWQLIVILSPFLLFILPCILCVKQAEKLNRHQFVWGVLGFFLSYIAVVILYFVLKKLKQCPHCGKDVTDSEKRCKHCGELMENLSEDNDQIQKKATKKCPYCGEEILVAAKKCKHCDEWLKK